MGFHWDGAFGNGSFFGFAMVAKRFHLLFVRLKENPMIVLFTTERDYPWGTLRSTHASKTKVVL
jgi:hypothetical protein